MTRMFGRESNVVLIRSLYLRTKLYGVKIVDYLLLKIFLVLAPNMPLAQQIQNNIS